MQAYNLFRSQCRDGLLCAVPEARSVPPFLTAPRWAFSGKIEAEQLAPLGFDPRAAAAGVRFNGFHLFVDFTREKQALSPTS
jgi:hypothetical protein